MSLSTVYLLADDPDAYVERIVTSATGANLTFTPEIASGDGPYTLTGTWQGAVAPTRTLRVPVAALGIGNHHLYLRVVGDNDIDLGWVHVAERFPGTTNPIAPVTADSIITALLADGGSTFRVALNALLGSGGGGGGSLTIINGGTITLDDDLDEGTLLGYRVTAETTFTATAGEVTLDPGVYNFERTATGWDYYTIAAGTTLTNTPAEVWAVRAHWSFTGTDGTSVSGLTDDENALTYAYISQSSGITGNRLVSNSNGMTPETSFVYAEGGDAPVRRRTSIDYDLTTDPGLGYNPDASVTGPLTTGGFKAKVTRTPHDAATATLTFETTYSGNPAITYEAGQDATLALTGNLMMEVRYDTEEVLIFHDTTLVGTVDMTGLLHSGNPNPISRNGGIGFDIGVRSAKVDNHKIWLPA